MLVMIDKQTTLKFFSAPDPVALEAWCRERNYGGVHPTQDVEHNPAEAAVPGEFPSVLAAALWHAETKHPDASHIDVCSFAGLVAYLATGWYGGFGTEEYEKERQAENIVIALAGGTAPTPYRLFGTIPESALTTKPGAEFTTKVLQFLDEFYFDDAEKAVTNLLETVDETTAARIVLGLARTQAQYRKLAEVANGFLKKKENISALRRAVRDVISSGGGTNAKKSQ